MDKMRLEHVGYVYGAGTPYEIQALKDISVGIASGSITGMIGHTGSGKSTLVQLLNGLEKPTEGHILLDETDIWSRPKEIRNIRFRVGLVMQYPEYQLFEETVRRDIAFGPRNIGLSEAEIERRVQDAASAVGLPEDLLDVSPFDLSGGQKRRVAIAGVLAMQPEVLVLDEPAAGLDPEGRTNMMQMLCRYRDTHRATVLIVSHSMEEMAVFCDRLIVLSHGKIVLQGTKQEVFSHPELLRSIGLGVPEVTETLELLRARGISIPEGIYSVEDAVRYLRPLITQSGGGDVP